MERQSYVCFPCAVLCIKKIRKLLIKFVLCVLRRPRAFFGIGLIRGKCIGRLFHSLFVHELQRGKRSYAEENATEVNDLLTSYNRFEESVSDYILRRVYICFEVQMASIFSDWLMDRLQTLLNGILRVQHCI